MRDKRFEELRKIPSYAAIDHRFFLNKSGKDSRLASLSRKERRQIEAEGRKIGEKYSRALADISKSGAGFPIDRLLRTLAIEYTHRYATSGTMTQPASFNYFEAFCSIKLFKDSFAPYAEPRPELDHLFSVTDFFDYLTDKRSPRFDLQKLNEIPEGTIYNFTQNGLIDDFTYLTAEGREFVISGFSIIRHASTVHWAVLGGEIFSVPEWNQRCTDQEALELENVDPIKLPFLTAVREENNKTRGAPLALEGTKTALKTVIAGETDLTIGKHVARCYMTEFENSFALICDDPETFSGLPNQSLRDEMICKMQRRIDETAVMWDLAEAFFQLPSYFQYRLSISQETVKNSNLPPPRLPRSGRGLGAGYKHVASLEISHTEETVIRSYRQRPLPVDTEGYYRRIGARHQGTDRDGTSIVGRTWIKSTNEWRARPDEYRTIYIKSSIATARLRASEYMEAANAHADAREISLTEKPNALYVMRCITMKDEIYKIGCTTKSAHQRAQELSSATGVPTAFVVVGTWQHIDPTGLERNVHALLDPYRINERREFFRIEYPKLKMLIEQEIERTRAFDTEAKPNDNE